MLAALPRRIPHITLPYVVIAAAAAAVALADYFLLTPSGTFKLPRDPRDAAALVMFVTAAVVAAGVSHIARRAAVQKRRAENASRELAAHRLRGNLLLDLSTRAAA